MRSALLAAFCVALLTLGTACNVSDEGSSVPGDDVAGGQSDAGVTDSSSANNGGTPGPDADHTDGGTDGNDSGHDMGGDAGPLCRYTMCGGECIDVEQSVDHCGDCDQPCEAPNNAHVLDCVSGTCRFECDAGFSDINEDLTAENSDGCESVCQESNGGMEACDGVDNDCDGQTDEGVRSTFYRDADDDSFGDPDVSAEACQAPDGYVDNADDCNDAAANANPDGTETCDGIDNDCDNQIDEGVTNTYFIDADGDGHGTTSSTDEACSLSSGWSNSSDDCDDSDDSIYPGAEEVCDSKDNDCDNTVDEGCSCVDGTSQACGTNTGECSTGTQTCSNGKWSSCTGGKGPSSEVCDGKDNDCDNQTDEGVKTTYYLDVDGDGVGTNDTVEACSPQGDYAALQSGDCDDSDPEIYPGNSETCDGKDNDCDNETDEGVTKTYCYNNDTDGYGDPNNTSQRCVGNYPTWISDCSDCDDDDADVNPGETEVCDGKDNDCDNDVDEGVKTRYYKDVDDDGYGVKGDYIDACSASGDYTATQDGDCDDSNAYINPDANDFCDGIDQDCDGSLSDGECPGTDCYCDTSTNPPSCQSIKPGTFCVR